MIDGDSGDGFLDLIKGTVSGYGKISSGQVAKGVKWGDDAGTQDASLTTSGNRTTLEISATSQFFSDARVTVSEGTTLLTTGATTFRSVNGSEHATFTGAGYWKMAGANHFVEDTTIDLSGGTVDLDNSGRSGDLLANNTTVDSYLTINARSLSEFGNHVSVAGLGDSYSELNIFHNSPTKRGRLTVNLDDPEAAWTVNPDGIVNYSGGSTFSFLAGSDVQLDGKLNVSGDGRSEARLLVGSTGTINVATDTDILRLYGGNNTDKPNLLSGGNVIGSGSVHCTVTIQGTLKLEAPKNIVQQDVSFLGAGTLENTMGSTLVIDNGHLINVKNDGTMVTQSSPGYMGIRGFTRGVGGTLDVKVGKSSAPVYYDRVACSGNVYLGGILKVSLIGTSAMVLGDSFPIITTNSSSQISGTFATLVQPADMPVGLKFEVVYLPREVSVKVVEKGSPFEEWIDGFSSLTSGTDKAMDADPDHDGMNNLMEFALDSDPTIATSSGKVVGKIAQVSGSDGMTMTIPVRDGATHPSSDPPGGEFVLKQSDDGVTYTVQGSFDLVGFGLTISEVTGADAASAQAGLPALHTGWSYRTFLCQGSVPGGMRRFIRVKISE